VGASGPGGGDPCAQYTDQVGTETPVVIVNATTRTIYLESTGCFGPPFDVEPTTEPDPNVAYVYDTSCLGTCEILRKGEGWACADCAPRVPVIAPGGKLASSWDGTRLRSNVTLEPACRGQSQHPICPVIEAVPPSELRFTASAHDACPDCSCDDGPDPVCFGTPSGAVAWSDPVKVMVPSAEAVVIQFGPCAFGCPPDSP
jgi:hypothetical protein